MSPKNLMIKDLNLVTKEHLPPNLLLNFCNKTFTLIKICDSSELRWQITVVVRPKNGKVEKNGGCHGPVVKTSVTNFQRKWHASSDMRRPTWLVGPREGGGGGGAWADFGTGRGDAGSVQHRGVEPAPGQGNAESVRRWGAEAAPGRRRRRGRFWPRPGRRRGAELRHREAEAAPEWIDAGAEVVGRDGGRAALPCFGNMGFASSQEHARVFPKHAQRGLNGPNFLLFIKFNI